MVPMLVAIVLVLSACAGPPTKNAPNSQVLTAKNAGLVVGSIKNGGLLGTGFTVVNTDTGESILYKGATEFTLWLPRGKYFLASVGTRAGSIGPYAAPLKFEVREGVINYVGALSFGCSATSIAGRWYGLQNCGFLALSECTVASAQVEMCVGDEARQAVQTLIKEYPEFSNLPKSNQLMQ